jgi:hypothetical protein
VFPTRLDVPLLAHAREVDISDTELMMGDDDGFLAVVIGNRLPLPGKDEQGRPTPVKYLACLVNLCGQLDALEETEPVDHFVSEIPVVNTSVMLSLGAADKVRMRATPADVAGRVSLPKSAPGHTEATGYHVTTGTRAPYVGSSAWAGRGVSDAGPAQGVYEAMAAPFGYAVTSGFVSDAVLTAFDPELRFPVLLHWSFTTTGEDTFESLVQALSSGLLGTAPEDADAATGRPPFEVVETGHVGLDHRLRVGDQVRSWYRGPFVPHPTQDPPEGRLAIAHTSDQLRIVVPDGREDLSLAAAFEIGRLLGLSRPSIVASLLRWRQAGFAAAWLSSTYAGRGYRDLVDKLQISPDRFAGGRLGALVASAIAAGPSGVLGNPSPVVRAGRAVTDAPGVELLAAGLGIDAKVLSGTPGSVLGRLQRTDVRLPAVEGQVPGGKDVRAGLGGILDEAFTRAAVQALAPELRTGAVTIDADRLPTDIRLHLDTARVPDIASLRERLGIGADRALPKSADQLDLLMHAAPAAADDTADTDEEES